MGISEEELPGIGHRYELDVRGRERLAAVVHNSGRRDLFAFMSGDSDPTAGVALDEDTARQLGAVLTGAYYRPAFVEPLASIIDRFDIDVVRIGERSPIAEKAIEDLRIRERTGVSVVAIITGKTALVDPAPSTVIKAGDLVAVVGQLDTVQQFRDMAEHRVEGAP